MRKAAIDAQRTEKWRAAASREGYKRRKSFNVHAAVDMLGHPLAQKVTAASEEVAKQGDSLEIVMLSEAKMGVVLLPKRWMMERTFGWRERFHRLSRDYERLPDTLAGLHWLAAVFFMLHSQF